MLERNLNHLPALVVAALEGTPLGPLQPSM
jgi:hypothetical protein